MEAVRFLVISCWGESLVSSKGKGGGGPEQEEEEEMEEEEDKGTSEEVSGSHCVAAAGVSSSVLAAVAERVRGPVGTDRRRRWCEGATVFSVIFFCSRLRGSDNGRCAQTEGRKEELVKTVQSDGGGLLSQQWKRGSLEVMYAVSVCLHGTGRRKDGDNEMARKREGEEGEVESDRFQPFTSAENNNT